MLLAAALLLDWLWGYPQPLFRRIGHPVVWMGGVIAWADRLLNRSGWSGGLRRLLGLAFALFLLGAAAGIGFLLNMALARLPLGWLLEVLLLSSLPLLLHYMPSKHQFCRQAQ